MKNFFKKWVILFSLIFCFMNTVWAEDLITEILPVEIPNEEIIEIISLPDPDPVSEVINIFIRNNDEVIFNADLDLPEEGIIYILDNDNVSHEVNSRSVLGLFYSISQGENASFAISTLQYYSSMNAFYLKCITPAGGTELCDNWQYVVGGITPGTGIDQTILSGNESVGLYFGNPHKLTLDKNEILEGESITVNSKKYNYVDNTWEMLNGVNISVTVPNETDPWNPTLISETAVDENGLATIILDNEGIYTLGIKEDYSFPSYQVTVKKESTGGGGNPGTTFSMSNAISFLSLNSSSFLSDSLYLDWVAIGIAQIGDEANSLKNQIHDYLKNNDLDSSIVTDNERRAMALMAMDIDPYEGTNVNYINKIISTFDGTQIGETSLYNDDIFALIVLSHAGYDSEEEIIKKIVSFLISKQSPDGSWGSIDITGAGVQALNNFENLEGVDEAISKGKLYLKNNQNTDGGFGNSFSTSWVVQALSLDNSYGLEVENAIDYLMDKQQEDGGLAGDQIESRIWATSYAIPAVLKLSWNDILEYFDKEEVDDTGGSNLEEQDILELNEENKIEDNIIKEEEIVEQTIKTDEKILKIKKENPLVSKVEINQNEELNNNLLTASAAGSIEDFGGLPSVIFWVIEQIKYSFLWLWFNLFSLI